jgi:hypothetical protein
MFFFEALPSGGLRIPLDIDYAKAPFLQSSTPDGVVEGPFQWSSAQLGRLLHAASRVEIGPRGLLFVMGAVPPLAEADTLCTPSASALCELKGGQLVLPSFSPNVERSFPVTSGPLSDAALNKLALAEDGGCQLEGRGGGRKYVEEAQQYTVTSCDVVQGTRLLVYEPRTGRLAVQEQTLGPMAYLIVLVSATVHICALAPTAATTGSLRTWLFQANAVLGIGACMVLCVRGRVAFHTTEDAVLFWLSSVLGLGYLGVGELQEACLQTLNLLGATVYRTHETPYAPILGYTLAFRTWGRLFRGEPLPYLLVSLLHASVFSEVALRPQCMHAEVWPLYLVFHLFITYSLAKFQDVCSLSPA